MRIIAYQDCYRPALVEAWNQSLTKDPISQEIIERKILKDENFDPALTLLALEGEEVAGFVVSTARKVPYLDRGLEPEKGWIVAMGVRPGSRGRGVGKELLTRAEGLLSARGATEIILGAYSPSYFFPGVDAESYAPAAAFFEQQAYTPGESSFAMTRTLFGYEIPPEVLEKEQKAREAGFRCLPYREEHRQALLDFLAEHFSAGWQYNARRLIEAGLGEAQIWLCLEEDGRVAGYCQRGMDSNPSRFGPFGVAEKHRNHSLGSILFCRMLYDMACRGIYLMFFLSTDDPGARFYRRHGLQVFRTFRHYEKSIR